MEDPNARKGVVFLSSWKQTTLWDYDRQLEMGFFDMESLFLPLKFCALHATGVHTLVLRLMKPIAFALMSKETRVRVVVTHLVDDSLLEALERYGLSKNAVPADDMGGSCRYDYREWLDKRRSAGK